MITSKDIESMRKKNDLEGLVKALEDSDEDIKIEAITALKILKNNNAVMPIVNILKDSHPKVRRIAVGALSEFKDKRAVLPLIKKLEDKRISVVNEVIDALGNIGDTKALGPLKMVFENKNKKYDPSNIEKAKIAIGRLDTTGAFEELVNEMQELEDATLKSEQEGKGYKAAYLERENEKLELKKEELLTEQVESDDIEIPKFNESNSDNTMVEKEPETIIDSNNSIDEIRYCPYCGKNLKLLKKSPKFCYICGIKFDFVYE